MTVRSYEAELTKPIRANYNVLVKTFHDVGIDFIDDNTVQLGRSPDKPKGRRK
jgi:hypothetical protein